MNKEKKIAIFSYGTLMLPEVLSIVLGRKFEENEFCLATLQDYERYKLLNQAYPRLRQKPNSKVCGKLFWVNDQEAKQIDYFEDDDYSKDYLSIISNEQNLHAWTYVDKIKRSGEEIEDWKMENFKKEDLENYLISAAKWMSEY